MIITLITFLHSNVALHHYFSLFVVLRQQEAAAVVPALILF